MSQDTQHSSLARVRGVGATTAASLLNEGILTAEDLAAASAEKLAEVPGIGAPRARALKAAAQELLDARDAESTPDEPPARPAPDHTATTTTTESDAAPAPAATTGKPSKGDRKKEKSGKRKDKGKKKKKGKDKTGKKDKKKKKKSKKS